MENKNARLEVEAGGRLHVFPLLRRPSCEKGAWCWTSPVTMELSAGVQSIRVISKGKPTVGREKVRIEQVCEEGTDLR